METIDLLKSIKKINTPFYLFDEDILLKRIDNIKKRLPQNAVLCYAIKANPFLIPMLKDSDILFEVCSPGELSICQNYNLSPSKIVFSGVCKTLEDIQYAYSLGVKTITLESPLHCEYLIKTIENSNEKHYQEVILRLTSGNQFGMSRQDILNCLLKLNKISSIKIRGIHYFTGTQKKLSKIFDEINFINNFCSQLIKESGISFSDIEYGPGLSYNYFENKSYEDDFSEFEQFSTTLKNNNFTYVIELGRYIASPCGKYITKIMDVKNDEEKRYCIIDGGINHINYYGQIMGMKLPIVKHIDSDFMNKRESNHKEKYTICGSLCTTADIVLRELLLDNPQPGDMLIFNDIGAYSITEGIYLFLSHPLPAVYIKTGNKLSLVRLPLETYKINFASNI